MGEFVWVKLALSDSQKQGRYCDTATHPDLIYLASLMKKYSRSNEKWPQIVTYCKLKIYRYI